MNKRSEEVIVGLKGLLLSGFAAYFETALKDHPESASALTDLLHGMIQAETAIRKERRVARCVQGASFVRVQTVDGFDFNYNGATRKIRKRYLQMIEANIVEKDVGAIFVGSSGMGKTHLARALGYAMCQKGERVLFTTCSDMLNRLAAAEATKTLASTIRKYESPGLVIIDEVGYVTLSQPEADLFFQIISRRHDRLRPTIVTTNRPFGEWNQVFHGDATAHVIVDRLTEKAEIFYFDGRSYRETHRTKISLSAEDKE